MRGRGIEKGRERKENERKRERERKEKNACYLLAQMDL